MNNFWKNIVQLRLNCIFIILYLAIAAHGASIVDTFKILDNEISIIENELIRNFAHIKTIFTSSYFDDGQFYRPLVSFSHMIEYQLFGLNASYYHLVNIFLHGICAALVFFIMDFLLKKRNLALLTGILFAIHPIHWEAVANIPGRSILLCALFYLFSFYGFCRFRRENKILWWHGLSLISFFAALLSKESAIMLPFVLLIYIWLMIEKEDRIFYFKAAISYFVLGAIFILIRGVLGITKVNFSGSIMESFYPFLTFLKSVLIHLKLILIPSGYYYDRSYEVFSSLNDPEVTITLIIWGVILSILFIKRKSISPVTFFLLFWFMASLFLVSQLFFFVATSPGQIAASDHLLYIPSVSLFALLILLAEKGIKMINRGVPRLSAAIKYLSIALFAVFFLVTVENDIYARNETVMLLRSHQNNPQNRRVHQSYAVALNRGGYFYQAEEEFRILIESQPYDVRAHVGLGRVFCDQKMLLPCIDQFQKAVHYSGGEKSLVDDLMKLYGYFIEDSQQRINEGEATPQLYQQLGAVYMSMGKVQEAENHFNKARQSIIPK